MSNTPGQNWYSFRTSKMVQINRECYTMPFSGSIRVGGSGRIPRRPPPEFEESDEDMMSGISEGGFLDVALNDVNQYGPHAMVMLLGVFASLTGLVLLLLMML